MSEDTERIRHNFQRMKILKALTKHVGVGVWLDLDELLTVLDKFNVPMVPDQLSFHLRYCQEQGWVELQRGKTKARGDTILRVKVTAAGIDRVDIGTMPELADTQKFPEHGK